MRNFIIILATCFLTFCFSKNKESSKKYNDSNEEITLLEIYCMGVDAYNEHFQMDYNTSNFKTDTVLGFNYRLMSPSDKKQKEGFYILKTNKQNSLTEIMYSNLNGFEYNFKVVNKKHIFFLFPNPTKNFDEAYGFFCVNRKTGDIIFFGPESYMPKLSCQNYVRELNDIMILNENLMSMFHLRYFNGELISKSKYSYTENETIEFFELLDKRYFRTYELRTMSLVDVNKVCERVRPNRVSGIAKLKSYPMIPTWSCFPCPYNTFE